MKKEECYYLGVIRRLHGLEGEVLIHLDVDDVYDYEELDSVFIQTKTGLIPYFIEYIQIRDAGHIIAKFEDCPYDLAKILLRKELYLPLSSLPKLEGNKFYYHEVIGFTVIDLHFGVIGPIEKVMDYPLQDVFSIRHDGKEVLVPVSDELIREVRRESREIVVDCPEGLIELYL
jgi:16S rRNA processing protein RimM